MEGGNLSDYELQRLEHIKRNQEFLARLGLVPLSAQIQEEQASSSAAEKQPRPKVPKEKNEPQEPLRRSARVLNKKPDYTGETIDHFADLLDRACAAQLSRRDTATDEEHKEALIEASREWLKASRDALLKVGLATGKTPTCADEWKREAELRWGPYVQHLELEDWQGYVTSRMSTPPPPSPLDLLQEYYAHDAWQLLVCCVLMSRVSSWEVKHKVIAAFFEKYPTPSSVLDADPQDIHKIIYPLGLFENRMQSLVAVTERFLQMPIFDVGLDKEKKIYGIGEFSYHSYLLFCRDAGTILKPKDAALASFASWRKRHDQEEKKTAGKDGDQAPQPAGDASHDSGLVVAGNPPSVATPQGSSDAADAQEASVPDSVTATAEAAKSPAAKKRARDSGDAANNEADGADGATVRRSGRQRKPTATYAAGSDENITPPKAKKSKKTVDRGQQRPTTPSPKSRPDTGTERLASDKKGSGDGDSAIGSAAQTRNHSPHKHISTSSSIKTATNAAAPKRQSSILGFLIKQPKS